MSFFILLGIFLVLVFSIPVVIYLHEDKAYREVGMWAIAQAVSLFAGFLFFSLTMAVLSGSLPTNAHVSHTDGLKALTNTETTSGQYHGTLFVSYGTYKSERVINFVEDIGNNNYVLRQVPASHVIIHEGPKDVTPTVKTTQGYQDYPDWLYDAKAGPKHYLFTVPAGTIGSDYGVDNSK